MNPNILPNLAAELRQRRNLLGLSQRAVAARAGLCHTTVSSAENGTVPGVSTLTALLAALGCELRLTDPGELETLRARVLELEAVTAAQRDALAQNRRYQAAFDALGRQPVVTHDLLDQARAAVGITTSERTAA